MLVHVIVCTQPVVNCTVSEWKRHIQFSNAHISFTHYQRYHSLDCIWIKYIFNVGACCTPYSTLSSSKLWYMVAGRSSTCEVPIRQYCYSVTDHCITIGVAKSKLTVVGVHGQKCAGNVGC